jgi:hypothetical protein
VVEHALKIVPEHGAAHIEHKMRNAIGGNFGDIAEDDGEDNGGEKRLEHEPERTQHRLLVDGGEISLDQEKKQVPVLPDLAPVDVPPGLAGFDDGSHVLLQ